MVTRHPYHNLIGQGHETGTTFFHGGKAYKVVIHPMYIAVHAMHQDKHNKWHVKEHGFFAQGEDKEILIHNAGGAYVNRIVDYLDSAGALPK